MKGKTLSRRMRNGGSGNGNAAPREMSVQPLETRLTLTLYPILARAGWGHGANVKSRKISNLLHMHRRISSVSMGLSRSRAYTKAPAQEIAYPR